MFVFLLGLVIGALFGFIIAGAMVANGRDDSI